MWIWEAKNREIDRLAGKQTESERNKPSNLKNGKPIQKTSKIFHWVLYTQPSNFQLEKETYETIKY